MSDKARFHAFNAVKRVLNGAYSNLVLPKELTGLDRAFAENIVLGTIERKITLNFVISKMVQREPQIDIFALLMTGVYQILYMDRVPDNAACNETVNIAKELFGDKSAGFVNGVLRNICRNKAEILENINSSDGFIKYSANEELYKLLENQYPDDVERIFASFLKKKPEFLRVNTLKTTAEELVEKIGGTVVDDTCIIAESPSVAVKHLSGGEFYIQGRGSQEAVKLLDALPGHTVVDVCACPGGKTLGAAIYMQNQGKIFAFDLHKNKLPLIEKSASVLGIDIIQAAEHNGKIPKKELLGLADRVICDVPCSGTGVMSSKPEIKYKSPEDFNGLYLSQKAILESASKYLKQGGIMVYSTCSINKTENEDIIEDFLNKNDGFCLEFQRTVLPYEAEYEGFYMARIRREK